MSWFAASQTLLQNSTLPVALMMAPLFWIITGEKNEVFAGPGANAGNWFEFEALFAVSLSCLFGLLISFFGFAARRAISITAFTVVALVNKFLTDVINVFIWHMHASPGVVCLCFTITGGVIYQQSVTGPRPASSESSAPEQIDSKK